MRLALRVLLSLGIVSVAACVAPPDAGESVDEHDDALSGCNGQASSKIPSSGHYFLTSFGATTDSGVMSCGENTDHGSWYYAASRQRYGCGSHIKIEANGKCVIAVTDDYGPDVCVENAAGGPIIDASPLVAKHLFGSSSAGWSDHFKITVTEVAKSTPLGPISCGSSGGSTGTGNGGGDDDGAGSGTLGGDVASAPAVTHNADGRLEVFAVNGNGKLVTSFQNTPNGGWSGWFSLGGALQGKPAVAVNEDGRIEVFGRGTDDKIHHAWQDAPNGSIGDFASLGGDAIGAPVVGKNKDGRLEVFVEGTDHAIYHRWQTSPGGDWSGSFTKLGDGGPSGGFSSPRVVADHAGHLWVFARGKDDAAWHIEETASGWSDWKSLGGDITSPAEATRNEDGRLEVFVIGTNGALFHKWEESPGGAFTSSWKSEKGGITDLGVANDKDGSIVVFARGTNAKLYRIDQKSPNGAWTGWTSLGGDVKGAPSAARNKDGRLETFFRASDDGVDHRWEESANGW